MREIKFRAWDKKNLKMQYSDIVWGITGLKYPALTGLDDNEDINTLSDLMQYTGLKDKNGKEIYEGDILNTPNIFEATNDDIAFLTKAYTNQSSELVTVFPVGMKGKAIKVGDTVNDGWCSIVKWDTETASFSFGRGMSKDAIVIGNIYENPELLK